MPRFDGTGPEGKGPRTGRGQGKCGDGRKSETPSESAPTAPLGRGRGTGRGQGAGQGRGTGRGNR